MQINIRGHETSVLKRWSDHIYMRLSKLEMFENRIIKIDFVLTSSHHHFKGNETCLIAAKVPRKTITVRKNAETMIEAIDASSKVLERQIRALWKDVKSRNRHNRAVRMVKRGILPGKLE